MDVFQSVSYIPQSPLTFKPKIVEDISGYWIEALFPLEGLKYENGSPIQTVLHLPDGGHREWFTVNSDIIFAEIEKLSGLCKDEIKTLLSNALIRRGTKVVQEHRLLKDVDTYSVNELDVIYDSIQSTKTETRPKGGFPAEEETCEYGVLNEGFMMDVESAPERAYAERAYTKVDELNIEILWLQNKCENYKFLYESEKRKREEQEKGLKRNLCLVNTKIIARLRNELEILSIENEKLRRIRSQF